MAKARYNTADPGYYTLLKTFADENKKHQTEAELLLWKYLSHNNWGLRFRRQYIVGTYIADFICLKSNTIIEIDGGYHSQSQQQIKDLIRTENLEQKGFHVIRFTNERLFAETSQVLDEIFDFVVKHLDIK